MALLAYFAFPNVVWSTARDLMNTLQDEDVEKFRNAFVAEDPMADLPRQDRHWGDCPAFLRASWNSAKAGERDVALAPSKKTEAECPPPQGGSILLLTWEIWVSGPLYDARLRTIAKVIYKQRPSAIILRGVNSEGVRILRKIQMWKRLRLSHVDFPHNVHTSPSLAIVAACDTVITDIEPFSLGTI